MGVGGGGPGDRLVPKSETEEGTYLQRVKRIYNMMNMKNVFITRRQIDSALHTLQYPDGVSESELATARSIKEATVHPDTGEVIFLPLRVSFIIPANLTMDTLMISASGPLSTIFAQWANQTYNALHYYANRNATNDEALKEVAASYTAAVVSSVGTALGLNSVLSKSKHRYAALFKRFVPFFAVAAADVCNIGIMRKSEWLEGVSVFDQDSGEWLGKSQIAGSRAVGATIFARITAAAPVLLLPPVIIHHAEQTSFLMKRPKLKLPALMLMIGFAIQCAVPIAFGVFKQTAHVPLSKLEPHFHNRVDSRGRPITWVIYNKGI